MNRIRDLREAKGLTQDQLASLAETTGATISRLESGERQLTQDWMERVARALRVSPSDLLDVQFTTSISPDIIEAKIAGLGTAAHHIASRGVKLYQVIGTSVEQAGIEPNELIVVDETPAALENLQSGSVVVVAIGSAETLVLRQWLAPNLLVTNHAGSNSVVSVSGRGLSARVVGVVVRDGAQGPRQ